MAVPLSTDFTDLALARVWNYWFAHRTLGGSLRAAANPYADDYELAQIVWFRGCPAIDAEIREHFAPLVAAAARGELDAWRATPRGCVALVLLLDQFPRNIDRGTARAFAHDARALAIATDAIDRGFERELAPAEALFVFLALVHAEDLAIARRGCDGIATLGTRCARRHQRTARLWHVGALKHLDLLERFGHYPHRNAALARASTADEEAFLAHPEFTAMFMRSQTPRVAGAPTPAPPRVHATGPRLRILALHGFRGNGEAFRARLRKMRTALEDIAELVFVTSPIAYAPTGDTRDATIAAFGEVPSFATQRVWWQANEDNSEYVGADATIAYLEGVVRTQGPFDGVLGFAQGGTLAALLAALQPHPVFAFQFAICIAAYPARARAFAPYVRPACIAVPGLTVLGLGDLLVTPDRSLQLHDAFDPTTAKLAKHPGGHFVPNLWPNDEIRAFVAPFVDRAAAAPGGADPVDAIYRAACAAITDGEVAVDMLRELAGHGAWRELQAVAMAVAARPSTPALVATHRAIVELVARQLERDVRAAATLHGYCEEGDGTARAKRLFAFYTGEPVAPMTELPEAPQWPSACARTAPRIGSRVDKTSRLAKDVARAMFPAAAMRAYIEAKPTPIDTTVDLDTQAKTLAYQRYGQMLALIGAVVKELDPDRAADRLRKLRRTRVIGPDTIVALGSQPIAAPVLEPEPEPVTPCALADLDPLLVHLRANTPVETQTAFHKGTLTPDGRLDLCKQVVGPDGIQPLLDAMRATHHVKRLLLGNNIVGDDGAAAIATFIRERADSPLDCWYIAGNHIGPTGIRHVCDALAHDTKVTSLWLKRNPLKPEGMVPIAALLRVNRTIEVLDLVNCGVLDDGLAIVIDALRANPTLKHLYLGTNGITERSAALLANFLATDCRLESLFLSCNRLGDDGVVEFCRGLSENRTLQRLSLASNRIGPRGATAIAEAVADHPTLAMLDLGFTRSTNSVGELGNFIGDDGARALADMLARNRALRSLDLLHNFISQVGVNHLRRALEVNRTLTALQLTQFGRVHNEPGKEELRAALERNRRAVPPEQAEWVGKVELPDHVMEIYSVYRTKTA